MKINILVISVFISLGICIPEENKLPNIHILFLGDVSYSMKDAYDNNQLEGKSGKIYDLFEDIQEDYHPKITEMS